MGEPEGEGAIHSPLPFVYRLQQSPVTFGFLIHQPYLSLAFTLPSLSAPGPKPVTGLGWARLALGPRAKGIGLGQPSRVAPPTNPQSCSGARGDCCSMVAPLYLFVSIPPGSLPFLSGNQEPNQTWREQRRLSNASASGQWSPTSDWVRDTAGGGSGSWGLGRRH